MGDDYADYTVRNYQVVYAKPRYVFTSEVYKFTEELLLLDMRIKSYKYFVAYHSSPVSGFRMQERQVPSLILMRELHNVAWACTGASVASLYIALDSC